MGATDQIDLVGIDLPLRFKVGETVVIPVSVLGSDGVSTVNITGRNYSAQIGAVGGSSIATFTKSNADDVNGTFELTLSSNITSLLSRGRYFWELWEDDTFLLGGPVEIVERKFTFA